MAVAAYDFALDPRALAGLRRTARKAPDEGLRQVAQQFEAVFMQRLLESMRDTVPEGGLLHSRQTQMYTDMLDRQWAQALARRGVGLADVLVAQLDRYVPAAGAGQGGTSFAIVGIPVGTPRQLAPSTLPQEAAVPAAAATPADRPLINLARRVSALVDGSVTRAVDVSAELDALPAHVSAFIRKMAPAARAAGHQSGLSPRLILAQAALETGWGQHETTGADGRPSHNVFNIKAIGWAGDSIRTATTEYHAGQPQQIQAAFRVYDSYTQAFADYVRLLTQSPHYRPVVAAATAEAAARQLQACGYATDPHYADKLIAIMRGIPQLRQRGPDPLFDHPSTGPLFADSGRLWHSQAPTAGTVKPAQLAQAYAADTSARRALA